ncbi:hypothetical protein FXO37_16682 [Capsicum annuum]|nr:hypothetical protein FXO37_16682 [Capsicum annuum]
MSSSDSSFWKEAINSEIDSILNNHTWELVDLPPKNKPLGKKWIFKRKMKTDGTIDKYNARFVVKGFKQKEGLDYIDTCLPIIRITSIRMLIVLATVYDLQIHQMDVKTEFLNGHLEEEIYMEQPEVFVVPGKENKLCKLIKDISDINATKRMLESKFDMKDLGVADVILGIRIHRTPYGLALSQSHYIEKVLDKFKYMEFDKACEEAEWLQNFLEDISYWPKLVAPICIHCDSQAAIGRAGSMMYNGKSHHIRRKHNTVRELLSSGIITIDYVKSKDNVSDPLTKGLSREGVERTSKGMGLRPRTSQHDANSCDVSSRNAETFSDACKNTGTGVGSSELENHFTIVLANCYFFTISKLQHDFYCIPSVILGWSRSEMKFQLVKMVESIGAISLLGRVPVYGVCYGKDLSSKRKAIDVCGMPSADFRGSEDRRIPKDFQYQIETDVDRKPGKWPPANKPENPALHIRLAPSSLLVKRSCTSEENGFSEGGDLSSVARRNL